MVVFHPFLLITLLAALHQKLRWEARMVVSDGAMGSAKLLEVVDVQE